MYPSRVSGAYGQPNTQPYSSDGASRHSALLGRHPATGARYGGQYTSVYGSTSLNSDLHADIYDRLDAATALREELLQTASLDVRQADYLAATAGTARRAGQEILPYGGRIEADLHTPSILGAASRREVEDLVYARGSANPGYGVSLPPGRDYVQGKTLHGISMESAYSSDVLARAGYSRLDDRKDDVAYAREIERREEDRRREILRERDRERDREREREREHRRERERILEKREREREREIRRDRTPPRISMDRARSTSAKRGRSARRGSPRRLSPVKEKRREYVCKVYTSNLVTTEKDYLSIDKRYSRLYVSPDCSKVIVNWSTKDLNIPFNTPISFEHDFVQEETSSERDSASTKTNTNGHVMESGTTRWKAKMILMSGLSRNAWEELSSERKYEDRIPHLCNMLRFACLKDGNTLMAIGGSCNTVDGNDPLVDQSTLIQTVLRYAKDLTGLDLKNCRNWNPFLEIHYDRVGKDGFFSHKEITVLYIPDLSDCLPSIDAWRDQWLAHKKVIAERERPHALKKEKSHETKEASKDKEPKTKKDLKSVEKQETKKDTGSVSKVNGKGKVDTSIKAEKAGKDGDKTVTEKKDGDKTVTEKKDADETVTEKKDAAETVAEGGNSGKKNGTDNASGAQTSGSGKKIIKKVVKKKVVKKDAAENAPKQDDKNTEVINEDAESSRDVNMDKTVKENEAASTASDVKPETNEAAPQDVGGSTEVGNKSEKVEVKEEKIAKVEGGSDKNEKSKDGNVKIESRGKEVKDKKKAEEPPRHPGLFLQTRGNKNSKLRSLSLSLDSLLDYTDKDTDESTFELSVFAETFYEMLQYQMGSRILTFLQKLRIKYVAKRNQKKRQREEASDKKEKENTKNSSSPKRQKTEDVTDESKPVKTETIEDEKDMVIDNVENTKEDESEKDEGSEEGPEEDPEEDEHMADASPKNDAENKEKAEEDKVDVDVKSEKKDEKVKNEQEDSVKMDANREKKENSKSDTKKKESSVTIDKELLQAFRFFDRNRVGCIRVEDLRLILHALGKCMSHRDVKELVQSALLESNNGRDDRILYNKLVKMTDI